MKKAEMIRLVALDIDGTLFKTDGTISKESIRAVREAQEKGVEIVVASGRNYDGLPWEQLKEIPVRYVVTSNGSAVYSIKDQCCIKEECMDQELFFSLLSYALEKEVYVSVFVDGKSYTPAQCRPYVDQMEIPEYVRKLLKEEVRFVDDLEAYIKETNGKIQKATLNFQQRADGSYLNRDEVRAYLEACPQISVVDGGFGNLEFTKCGVSKAVGVQFLAGSLNISKEEVMAVGDSENDLEMIRSAGLGVAMGNASETVKNAADEVTFTNDEEGVAAVIDKYVNRNNGS